MGQAIALGVAVVLIGFCLSLVLAALLTGLYFLVEAVAKWIGNKLADKFFGRVPGGRK